MTRMRFCMDRLRGPGTAPVRGTPRPPGVLADADSSAGTRTWRQGAGTRQWARHNNPLATGLRGAVRSWPVASSLATVHGDPCGLHHRQNARTAQGPPAWQRQALAQTQRPAPSAPVVAVNGSHGPRQCSLSPRRSDPTVSADGDRQALRRPGARLAQTCTAATCPTHTAPAPAHEKTARRRFVGSKPDRLTWPRPLRYP